MNTECVVKKSQTQQEVAGEQREAWDFYRGPHLSKHLCKGREFGQQKKIQFVPNFCFNLFLKDSSNSWYPASNHTVSRVFLQLLPVYFYFFLPVYFWSHFKYHRNSFEVCAGISELTPYVSQVPSLNTGTRCFLWPISHSGEDGACSSLLTGKLNNVDGSPTSVTFS